MTHPDHTALLAAVCAAPDDDAPRLVLADWLDEHSLAARAEFIRVQVELARVRADYMAPDCDPRRHYESLVATGYSPDDPKAARFREIADLFDTADVPALRRRERELLAGPRPHIYENEVCWFNAGDGTDTWRYLLDPVFRRGFVASVTCDAASWLKAGDALSWSPEQTEPCPTCDEWRGKVWRADRTKKMMGLAKSWCCTDGQCVTGRVPRPCPPTAQPVTEVRLTTRPEVESYPYGDGFVRDEIAYRLAGTRPVIYLRADCPDDPAVVLLRDRWPAVKTWHLPPEHPRDDRGRWTAEDEARAVNGDPDAPLPLGVMDVETTDWDSAESLSAAPPDNARRRAGHSRLPAHLRNTSVPNRRR